MAEACDRSSRLAGCVAEAVRVRAPGVAVRMATCDLAMPLAPGRSVHISKVRQVLPHSLPSQVLPVQLGSCRSTFCLFLRTGQSNFFCSPKATGLLYRRDAFNALLSLGHAVPLYSFRTLKCCDLPILNVAAASCVGNAIQHITHHHLTATFNLNSHTCFGL